MVACVTDHLDAVVRPHTAPEPSMSHTDGVIGGQLGHSFPSPSSSVLCSSSTRFPQFKPDGTLDPAVDFSHSVQVTVAGLAFPKDGDEGPFSSLDNFDEKKTYGPRETIFNSPRTVTACLRLGIAPHELLKEPLVIASGVDLDIIKVRYIHKERRRKQKLAALKEERASLTEADCQLFQQEIVIATACQEDEARLQKIIAANLSRQRQQLVSEQRARQKSEEWEARLQLRQAKHQSEMEKRAEEVRRKEQDAEARAREFRMLKEAERQAAEEMMWARQEEYAEQERRRQLAQEEKARQLEAEHQNAIEKTRQRQQQIRKQSEDLQKQRLEKYIAKIERAEQARHEFEKQNEELKRQAEDAALLKSFKVRMAQERSRQSDAYRVALALEKQRRAEETRQKFEETRQLELEQRKQLEAERELHRLQALALAQFIEEQKKEAVQKKLETIEEKQERLRQEREVEKALQSEERRLHLNDKLETVEHMRKMDEFYRFRILQRIRAKAARVEALEQHKELNKQKRKEQREQAERHTASRPVVSPGPGEYLGPVLGGDRHSPSWKFGIPHDSIKGICNHELAKEFLGKDSPGPAAYGGTKLLSRKGMAYTMPRAERFSSPLCNIEWIAP